MKAGWRLSLVIQVDGRSGRHHPVCQGIFGRFIKQPLIWQEPFGSGAAVNISRNMITIWGCVCHATPDTVRCVSACCIDFMSSEDLAAWEQQSPNSSLTESRGDVKTNSGKPIKSQHRPPSAVFSANLFPAGVTFRGGGGIQSHFHEEHGRQSCVYR